MKRGKAKPEPESKITVYFVGCGFLTLLLTFSGCQIYGTPMSRVGFVESLICIGIVIHLLGLVYLFSGKKGGQG